MTKLPPTVGRNASQSAALLMLIQHGHQEKRGEERAQHEVAAWFLRRFLGLDPLKEILDPQNKDNFEDVPVACDHISNVVVNARYWLCSYK